MSQIIVTETMILSNHWRFTKDGDLGAFSIARRHYSSFKNPNPRKKQFVGPGQKMVLVNSDYSALFVWRKFIDNSGQVGVNCALFRNESNDLSSDLILEAEQLAWQRWPNERLYTYVDKKKINSTNPGYCFIKAGWRKCGITKKKKLIIFEKLPQP